MAEALTSACHDLRHHSPTSNTSPNTDPSPRLLWVDLPVSPLTFTGAGSWEGRGAGGAGGRAGEERASAYSTMGEVEAALQALYASMPADGMILVLTQGSIEAAKQLMSRKQR